MTGQDVSDVSSRRHRAAAAALGLLIAAAMLGPAAAQTGGDCAANGVGHLAGAYRTADGAVLSVLPEGDAGAWRVTHFGTGRSHRLQPTGDLGFQASDDMDGVGPPVHRYRFELDPAGGEHRLGVAEAGRPPGAARRLPLREVRTRFRSGEVELHGSLTLPPTGAGPFKTVVFVHGSDPVPSAGREWLPHLLAANGIAAFVFDKRGTGCSAGRYVQHFGMLSDDVVAAVRWLRERPEVDRAAIGLAGFSQGGWVAPLAALKEPAIRFVAVGYGLAMSMADEDRLEAPLKLRALGVGDAAVAEYEALNATLHALARAGFQDWGPFERQLEQFKDRPWMALARSQPSWVGVVLQMGLAQAKAAAPGMFQHFFQPFYDPVPTLETLPVPMLWLIAADDREAPPGPTLAVLERLQRQGRPVSTVLFPNADHGIVETTTQAGQRIRTGHSARYFTTLLDWVRAQP